MQKQEDVKELFNKIPQQLKKLVLKPQFIQKKFKDLTLKNIQALVNYTKTKTLLSLLLPSNYQTSDYKQMLKCETKPIILVFCQPSQQLQIDSNNQTYPYVPIAYCSWIQSLGAKCIPLSYNTNEGSMQFLLQRCHGLIVPGGGSNLYKSYQNKQGYGPVTLGFQKIWRMINKLWQKGIYFPVWGTCLGLEMVIMAVSNDVKILSNLNSRAHQLQVYSDYQNSSITSNMPTSLRIQIQNRKLLNFQHVHGISVQKFLNTPKLNQKLKITGISKDKDGTWFCSLIQGRQNPIFLSQFHPQKQCYQWTCKGDIIHQKYSIMLSQYFGQQFLSHCIKCKPPKTFSSQKQLTFYLIEQYKQIHTPQKMYKVYAIDYKYRYVDKQAHKEIKNQRSMSSTTKSITSNGTIGSSKKLLQQKGINNGSKVNKVKRSII